MKSTSIYQVLFSFRSLIVFATKLVTGFIIIALPSKIYCQNITVYGKVFDQKTDQLIPTVSVQHASLLKAAITDEEGSFKMVLPPGEHKLVFSHIGYERFDSIFNLGRSSAISVYLNPVAFPVGEVTIVGDGRKDLVASMEMGTFTLSNREMKTLPSLMGEVDPLRLVQLAPGIQTSFNAGAGFYVRGGGVDQNLVIMDQSTLYNPGHLMGIFSVFNSDMIRDVSVIKSGIPARYGGKLSSVIRLNTYKGNMDSLEVKGSTGLIFSKLTLDGPLIKNKMSFILGARRTYIGLILNPIVKNTAGSKSFLNKNNNYSFYDINAGISFQTHPNDIISLSFYHGRDNYTLLNKGLKQESSLDWGNSMISLNWKRTCSQKGILNNSFSWSNYNFNLSGAQSEYHFGLYSEVEDFSLKSEYHLNSGKNLLTAGIELIEHSYIPNKIDIEIKTFNVTFLQFEKMYATEGGLFIENEYNPSSRFGISGGLRISLFNQHGPGNEFLRNSIGQIIDTIHHPLKESLAFFIQPEPRLLIKYQYSDRLSVKASYMRIAQYNHLATSSSATLPMDIWIPSTKLINPTIGDQVSIGYFRNLSGNTFELSAEIFYKKMNNQIEFLRGILLSSLDGSIEENLVTGIGRSYGFEWYLAKISGKNTGWISYTLSRTEHRFKEINKGLFYPAKYDRIHDFSLTLSREFGRNWVASATFIYITGNAFTMPIGRYIVQGYVVNQYGNVNSFRMPDNHRLDISLTRKLKKISKFNSELVLSVYNVYNRANPFYIYYEVVGKPEEYALEVKAFQVNLLPIIPSLTWNFSF